MLKAWLHHHVHQLPNPLGRALQLQTEIALSSTESEFIGLLTALCTTILIMELVKEIKSQGHNMVSTNLWSIAESLKTTMVHLRLPRSQRCNPESSISMLSSTTSGTMSNGGEITLHTIKTHDQPVDMLTKPLSEPILNQNHVTIMGWSRKGNAEKECEDIHLGGSHQCHVPMGRSKGTKSMQGHPTRSAHKVIFSQSGPTMIMPNLNNFSARLHRSPRPEPKYWVCAHVSPADGQLPAGWETRTIFISHFDWFGIHLPKPTQQLYCHLGHMHVEKIQNCPNFQDSYSGLFSLPVY